MGGGGGISREWEARGSGREQEGAGGSGEGAGREQEGAGGSGGSGREQKGVNWERGGNKKQVGRACGVSREGM